MLQLLTIVLGTRHIVAIVGNIKRPFSVSPTNADNEGGEVFIETKKEKERK